MGIGDVAGVFSRYFIVGFFLPTFFALVALSQTLTDAFLPSVYLDAGDGARIAILGGAGLLVGLVLSGLHYSVLRLYEGYPLEARATTWYAQPFYRFLMKHQHKCFADAKAACEDPDVSPVKRRTAKWRLDRHFPWDADNLLLPTRFGNALRAFERHPRSRWGLNGIAAWPHVEMLMSTDETAVHTDAKGDLAFFINGSLVALVAGCALVADGIAHQPVDWYLLWLYVIPFALSAAFYKAAIGATIRWGSAVRASMDIHRLELYEKLGLRKPNDFTDERERIAPAVNGALLRAEAIPDSLVATDDPEGAEEPDGATIKFGGMSLRLEQDRE